VTQKLAKYMAACGVASRRKCEDFIRVGWVKVDGQVITTPETRVDPERASIELRGRPIQKPASHRYILLHKPVGVLSTCRKGREKGRTVLDLVKVPQRIFPAGRLDRDTSGLLLLTDDGDLVQRLMHPSFGAEREYEIETLRPVSEKDLSHLRRGVQLEDGESKFLEVKRAGKRKLRVILAEGRKRQIRRTLAHLSLPIKSLTRTRIEGLQLSGLPVGRWRDLTDEEIKLLNS
jgi:pseudouridine synthase